jgi:cytochrome c554/c'-like protein
LSHASSSLRALHGALAAAVVVACLAAMPSRTRAAAAFTYVGSTRCRICHSSERIGGQYQAWAGSRHAKAYETLATDKAQAMARKQGIADPQKSAQCLACHSTGAGLPPSRFEPSFAIADGVTCEACHGPGGSFAKISIMQGIRKGRLRAKDYGLTVGDKAVCAACHNEDPHTGGFVAWPRDSARIAHPIPAGYTSGDQAGPAGQ